MTEITLKSAIINANKNVDHMKVSTSDHAPYLLPYAEKKLEELLEIYKENFGEWE